MRLKRKPALLQEARKQIKAETKRIRKIKAPQEQLAAYKELQAGFAAYQGHHDLYRMQFKVQDKMDKVTCVTMMGFTGPAIISALCPPLLVIFAAVSVPMIIALRQSEYKGVAKSFGVSSRDMRSALKTYRLEEKVNKAATRISSAAKITP